MLILDSMHDFRTTAYTMTKHAHKIVLEYHYDSSYIMDIDTKDIDDALETISYLVVQGESKYFVLRWFDTGLEKKKHVYFLKHNCIVVTSRSVGSATLKALKTVPEPRTCEYN